MGKVFNVGARRSGTYWLQRIVCAHPSVAEVPSETYLFSHGIAPLMERFQHEDPSLGEVGQVYADREAVLAAVRALVDEVLGGFARAGELHVAERTPWHVLHLPLIAEVCPEARFVHIIRDGRDVARSIVAQPWGPDTVAGAAEEWRAAVQAGLAAAPALGERLLEVRFERLLSAPAEEVARIYGHLGLSGSLDGALAAGGRVENLGGHDKQVGAGKWRGGWSRREVGEFDRVAGELWRELGYDQGP